MYLYVSIIMWVIHGNSQCHVHHPPVITTNLYIYHIYIIYIIYRWYPTTSKNEVKRCRPSKTMTLLKDTHWLLIYTYIYIESKKGDLSPEPNRIRKSILKILNKNMWFPCSSFWLVFTGFSLSFHGFFTVVSRTFHALGLEWDLFETLESGIYLY